MRVLMHSPSPKFDTGMGKVANELARGLTENDHDVHVFSPTESKPEEAYNGYTLHGDPNSHGNPGAMMFRRLLSDVAPDVVVSNRNWLSLDWLPMTLNNYRTNENEETPVVLYGPPVETESKPPLFEETIFEDHLNDVWMVPFTENRYSQAHDWGLGKHLLPADHDAAWVPHGVDHDVFNPEAASEGLRSLLGEDRFVATIVCENWRRKNLDVLFDAWARFRNRVRSEGGERPILAMQTDPKPSREVSTFYNGWNLGRLAAGTGLNMTASNEDIDADTDVFTNKSYVKDFSPREVVAGFMATADLYVLPTSGEAFSLTSLEAMACGTPLLQTDVATLRWLCGDASGYVDTCQMHALRSGERMPTPDVEDLADSLFNLRWCKHVRERMAEDGIERAQDFSWDRTAEEFAQAVEYAVGNSEW